MIFEPFSGGRLGDINVEKLTAVMSYDEEGLSKLKIHKQPPEILGIFIYAVIQCLDVLAIQKT